MDELWVQSRLRALPAAWGLQFELPVLTIVQAGSPRQAYSGPSMLSSCLDEIFTLKGLHALKKRRKTSTCTRMPLHAHYTPPRLTVHVLPCVKMLEFSLHCWRAGTLLLDWSISAGRLPGLRADAALAVEHPLSLQLAV